MNQPWKWKWKWKSLSRDWLFAAPWTIQSMEFSRQNTGVDSLSLLQGIFSSQGLNPGLPHCRWTLYQLSHQGNATILEWVAYPFSRGSSWPRIWTGVPCIAGGFFTNWAIKVKVKVAQSCPTLCDPIDHTVHEILQARILEWIAFPFSSRSSQPRDQTQVSRVASRFFTSWATREALTT